MPSHSPFYDLTVKVLQPLAPHLPTSLIRWEAGVTPLSDFNVVVAAMATYLITIFSLRAYINNLKAQKKQAEQASGNKAPATTEKGKREPPYIPSSYLKIPFFIHNVILSAGSGWLLVLMLEEILPIVMRNGPFYSICSPGAWTMRMETFYIINYYIKYYELLDTIFMVLKEKPLSFLHVYHHSATALLCFTQLQGKTSVSWVVICLNLAVHVLMYAYYALTTMGVRVPWKKMVTVSQIVQFVIDLFIVYYAAWNYWTFSKWQKPTWSHGTCAGSEAAALSGMGVLSSYLVLFIIFYNNTYKKTKDAAVAVKNKVAAKAGKAN